MKKLLSLLLFVAGTSHAVQNQLEFLYGWATPRNSIDAGNGSEPEGSRGREWIANFLHKKSRNVYFGVGGGRFRSGDRLSGTFVPQGHSTISSRMSFIFGLARVDFSANPKVRTYGIAGAGWVKHALSVTATPHAAWSNTGTSERRTIVKGSQDAFGYAGGLGMDFALNDRLFIGIEGRYQGALKKTFQMTAEGAATTGRASISVPMSVYLLGLKAGVQY